MPHQFRPAVVGAALWLTTVVLLQVQFLLRRGVGVGELGPLVAVLHEPTGIGLTLLVGAVSVALPTLALVQIRRDAHVLGDEVTTGSVGSFALHAGLVCAGLAHLYLLLRTPARLAAVELYTVVLATTLLSVVIFGFAVARR